MGSSGEGNYRSVITREAVRPPVCLEPFASVQGGKEKGLLMEIHSELIAGHYTTTGRDQRKQLNGRGKSALVNHHTHTHTHARSL